MWAAAAASLQEVYRALPNKTRTFFRAVTQQWDPDWVIKMDDDVYLNTARLLDAARQWDVMGAQYVGCMKHGVVWRQPGVLPVEAVSAPTVTSSNGSCIVLSMLQQLLHHALP